MLNLYLYLDEQTSGETISKTTQIHIIAEPHFCCLH
jgi:hypothetical protein